MPTSLQLISDIRGIASSGPATVDFRIPDAEILHWINEVRSMMINQSIQKRGDISDVWIQTIGCLDMIVVDTSECCEITTDCNLLRSNVQIPPTIETDGINMIMSVSGLDDTVIAKINSFRARLRRSNRFIRNTPGWYIKNRYIYISNSDNSLAKVTIRGIFENPLDLANFVDCSGDACIDLESEYPISLKMANEITNYIFKTKILPFMSLIQDNTNDGADEVRPSGQINPKLQS